MSAHSEPDLFWAGRGGGGESFGVVTSFTLSTHVAPTVLGGAVADVAPSGSAFVHRRSPFSVQYTATWAGSHDLATPYDALVRSLRAAMTPWSGDTAYVNYPDAALPNWQNAYWGANRSRLEQIKRTVDPDDVFHFAQSIGR